MNSDSLSILLVAVYLIGGTVSIVWVMGWALKRFGPPKKPGGHPVAVPGKNKS